MSDMLKRLLTLIVHLIIWIFIVTVILVVLGFYIDSESRLPDEFWKLRWILRLIICFGVLGLFSAFAAIRSVRRQLKDINKNPNPLGINITEDCSPAEHATRIREILKLPSSKLSIGKWSALRKHFATTLQASVSQPVEEDMRHLIIEPLSFVFAPFSFVFSRIGRLLAWWYAPQNLLHLRLEPMLNVAEAQEGRRRLPCIDDLHEWSRERELSRPCVSLHGLVVGSLLIVGILGTLIGVHTSLKGDSEGILQRLLPALEPSMWAVGFTIVLTAFKGGYTYLLDQLLSRLDRYTLDTLIPALQTADEYEDMDERMSDSLQKINETLSHYDEIAAGMSETGGAVRTYAESLIHASDELQAVTEELAGTEVYAKSARGSLAEVINRLKQLSREFAPYFRGMNADAHGLHALGDEACTWMEKQGAAYAETRTAMEAEAAALTIGLEGLISKAHSFDGLEETVNSLSRQTIALATMHSRAVNMKQEVDILRGRVSDITERTHATCQHLQSIYTAENQAVGLLKNTIEATHSMTAKQNSYAEHVVVELLHPLADSMEQHANTQHDYVDDIAEHSKKYRKSIFFIIHPLEWVALIIIIIIKLSL